MMLLERPQRRQVAGLLESIFSITRIATRNKEIDALRLDLEAKVAAIFERQKKAVLKALDAIEHTYPIRESFQTQAAGAIDLALLSIQDDFAKVIQDGAVAGLLKGWSAERLSLGFGIAPEFNLQNPRAVAFLKERGLEQAKKIDAHTKDVLRGIVTKRIEKGETYNKTTEQIRSKFDSFSEARAKRIAVYESAVAYEEGSYAVVEETARTTGLEYEKRILIVGDDRTEQHCWDADAQGWIRLDGSFSSGVGTAPLHVGCRCTTEYRRKPGQVIDLSTIAPLPKPAKSPKPKAAPAKTEKPKLLDGKSIRKEFEKKRVSTKAEEDKAAAKTAELRAAGAEWRQALLNNGFDFLKARDKEVAVEGKKKELSLAIKAIAKKEEQNRKSLHDLLRLPKDEQQAFKFKWQVGGKGKAQKERANEAVEFLSSIIKKRDEALFTSKFSRGDVDFVIIQERGRAYALPEKRAVHLAATKETRTYVHEIAHLFEGNEAFRNKVFDFYEKRTKGEKLERLRDLVPGVGYKPNELTKKDKFIDPYIGKDYTFAGKRVGTELTSMAAEYLFAEPQKLLALDPEMFDFFVDLFRNLP